jgi:hypothetical protein
MSSSADGILRISRLTDNGGELIGNVLHLENTVTSASRVGNNEISVSFDSGNPQFFLLSSVVKIPLVQSSLVSNQASGCKRWDDSVVYTMDAAADGKLRTSKGELNRIGPRQLAVASQGVQVAVSPTFSNEVILACLSEAGDSLAITTDDFVTEIWAIDFSRRFGLPIAERRVFHGSDSPASTKRVFVPRGNKVALIESSRWDPPNLEYQWYSLWDLETSLPLMDRTLFENDMEDDEVERAAIDPSAQYIIFAGQSKEHKLVPLSSLHLAWPEAANNWIPDFVEALGGVAINSGGVFEPVPDRPSKIKRGFEKISELVSGFKPESEPAPQSGRGESGLGPIVLSSPSAEPQSGRVEANSQPIAASPLPTTSNDPVGAVRAFYLALSRADGEAAQLFVVPEKRGIGPFNQTNIKQFYSSLPKPMELLGVELASNDAVKVKYHFVRPNGSECHGDATVSTTFSGGRTLIRRITANC